MSNTAPPIGQIWQEQGGIYAGIAKGEDGQPDHHLILSDLPYQNFEWQAGLDAAKNLTHEGHSDWRVPTRNESALLYANVREQIETGDLYWTSTPSGTARAWGQDFYDGFQDDCYVSFEARVRFVRRVL